MKRRVTNWEDFKRNVPGAFPPEGWDRFIDAVAALDWQGDSDAARKLLGTDLQPFEILDATTFEDDEPHYFARLVTSTLAGDLADGFFAADDPHFTLELSIEEGVIYGQVDINTGTGAVTGRSFHAGEEMPNDNAAAGHFYVRLGSWVIDGTGLHLVNDRYGPIDATVYRLWAINPKTFSISWVS